MDPHPSEPAKCARRDAASARYSRSGRRSHSRMARAPCPKETRLEERRVRNELASRSKNRGQLLRCNHFQLSVRTVARLFVGPPPAKLRRMAKAITLHVLVRNFHYQFRAQRLPGQIFSLAPPALSSGHSLPRLAVGGSLLSPSLPGMIRKRVFAKGRKKLHQLRSLFFCEAGTNTHKLERARSVLK